MRNNQINLISDNLYIFEEPELASIKVAVHEALAVYAREVMGIPQTLYVTQSWTLINKPGAGMHGHSHSNSIVSGSIYYTDLPSPGSNMIFDRHRMYQQLQLHPDADRHNLFNSPRNVVTPQKHDLVMFPSSLNHFVETNQAAEPRYSISFNAFVKGEIGGLRDVSRLEL